MHGCLRGNLPNTETIPAVFTEVFAGSTQPPWLGLREFLFLSTQLSKQLQHQAFEGKAGKLIRLTRLAKKTAAEQAATMLRQYDGFLRQLASLLDFPAEILGKGYSQEPTSRLRKAIAMSGMRRVVDEGSSGADAIAASGTRVVVTADYEGYVGGLMTMSWNLRTGIDEISDGEVGDLNALTETSDKAPMTDPGDGNLGIEESVSHLVSLGSALLALAWSIPDWA